jgi:hypothetical protein
MSRFSPVQPGTRLAAFVPKPRRIAGDERTTPSVHPAQRRQSSGTKVRFRGDALSVSAISSSAIANTTTQSVHNNLRQFQQEFLQLGSDLQSGNLTAAKQDYAQLHNLAGEGEGSSGSTNPSNPLVEQFNQLGKDLVSGNVTGAQQDYSNLKQDFQKIDKEHDNHQFPVRDPGGPGQPSPAGPVGPATPADPGGLASPSADVVSAQSAYNSLLQGIQNIGSEDLIPSFQAPSGSSSVSISA